MVQNVLSDINSSVVVFLCSLGLTVVLKMLISEDDGCFDLEDKSYLSLKSKAVSDCLRRQTV